MAERRTFHSEPQDEEPPRRSNGNGVWKILAIALISFVGTGVLAVWVFTRNTPTVEQVREERSTSKEERALSKQEIETALRMHKELEDKVFEVRREQDRRGGRLELLEDALKRLEARLVGVESAQGVLTSVRVELRVLQEALSRMEGQLREMHDRAQRRLESTPEPKPQRKSPLPKGFP